MSTTTQRWQRLADLHHANLLETARFWETYGIDREHGGFLFYLDRDGTPYGHDKPVWLIGRATWFFATLCSEVEQRDAWLAHAKSGWDFLEQHCADESGKLYFLVDRAGRPLRMRRYVFSEVFAVLAASALYRATGDERYRERAVELFNQYDQYCTEPGLIPAKVDPITRPTQGLAPVMCRLQLAEELLADTRDKRFETIIDDTLAHIFRDFVKPEEQCVPETVGLDGELIDGPDGRVMNPGHVIEAAWFILQTARRRGDAALVKRATPALDWSLTRGWDAKYGGLRYFVDIAGKPPTLLEHDMKLWWPHCEALIATMLAYELTSDAKYAKEYDQLHAWTHEHFPDPEFGEWFGYMRRDGSLSTPLKGGPWKGPFHVPRAQLLCSQIASRLAQAKSAAVRTA